MAEYISIIREEIDPLAEHRYLRLPHPRTGQAQLYLPFSSLQGDGICEVVKISGARGRTWFIGDDKIAQGTILIHQPIDPLFLAIPVVLSLLPSDSNSSVPFQPLSDLLSTAASSVAFALSPAFAPTVDADAWNGDVARLVELKSFRRAFRACCERKLITAAPPSPPADTNDGPSRVKSRAYYRPSRDLVLRHLRAKVDRLGSPEQFGKFDHLVRALGRDGLLIQGIDKDLVQAARIRAAIEHITQYIPQSLLLVLRSSYDFTALETHLGNASAAALAASLPISNGNGQDKGKGAGVKRKAPAASRGVESLKKVNTKGMAKMSSFFKPKEPISPSVAKK